MAYGAVDKPHAHGLSGQNSFFAHVRLGFDSPGSHRDATLMSWFPFVPFLSNLLIN